MKILDVCMGLFDICEVIDCLDVDIIDVFGWCMQYVKVVLCFKLDEVSIVVLEWVVVMLFDWCCWVEQVGFDVDYVEMLFVQFIVWYIVQ